MASPALADPSLPPELDLRHRRMRDLVARVEALGRADSLVARLDALERLLAWLAVPDRGIPVPAVPSEPAVQAPWRRLAAALAWLERDPAPRATVARAVAAIVGDTRGTALFSEAGMPNDRGLAQETADRLFRRLLPAPRDEHDLGKLVARLFPSARAVEWIDAMPADLFQRLAAAVASETDGLGPLLGAAADALVLLAARVQGLGLSEELRTRGRDAPVKDSPFYRLPRGVDAFLDARGGGPRIDAERTFHDAVAGCRAEIQAVLEHLEATGVSLDVVYSLEVIEQALGRMEHLLRLLASAPGLERAAATHRLVVVLASARLADRSLRDLGRANLRLLARKIIERAGKTGEHYITYTRREYYQMMASAAGGGLLTVGTVVGKILVTVAHFAPFVEGFLAGGVYALSFILLQIFGFTLATKQPSMTAAQLAGVLREGTGRIDEMVTHVARICRSQLAAAIGNVVTVAVSAVALDFVWRWRTGHSFMGVEKADKVIASFHPTHSGTIWYAIITGVILWASSLAAGWVENFVVYRRLPQAIAEHRLGRLLGQRAMSWLGAAFARNVSGFGGSIALGFMLGMCPIIGQFLGLPLDVRHVTLSTGTLALAACTKGPEALGAPLATALAGIGVIFILNLSVSFNLALTVAMRARAVSSRDRWALTTALFRRFLRHPGQFLLPPGAHEQPPADAGHGSH